MLRRALLCAAIVTLAVATPAFASPRSDDHDHRPHHRSFGSSSPYSDERDSGDSGTSDFGDSSEDDSKDDSEDSGSDTSDVVGDVAGDVGTVVGGAGKILGGATRTIAIAQTGYSFADNTPNNSDAICCAIVHDRAGGSGSYADPVSVATAGSGSDREFPPGTRFYLPSIHKYGLIEDSGGTPMGKKHLDVYVNGKGLPKSASDACMEKITGDRTAIVHPGPGLLVTPGPITTANGCNL